MTEAMEACVHRIYKIEQGIAWPDVSPNRENCSTQFDELKLAVRLNGFSLNVKCLFARPVAP
jgi:hypothetical protein